MTEAPDPTRTARDRVRHHLIRRLHEAGAQRPKGLTAEAWAATVTRLVERLAYMTDDNLITLAEVLLTMAMGAKGMVLPSELVIMQNAHALQAPPVEESRIVTSWLACVEGPLALAGGYAVDLYFWLLRHGRPPLDYDMNGPSGIRAQAAEAARRAELIRGRIERGTATQDDNVWLESRMRAEAKVRQIIMAGEAARAAKGEAA